MSSRIIYTPREVPQTKRLRKILIAVSAVAAVFLLAAAITYLIRLPSLHIREISFSGMESSEEDAARERIGSILGGSWAAFLPRSFYFLADAEEIAAGLGAEFPQAKEIEVTKTFPDRLSVVMMRRSFWGIFCSRQESVSAPHLSGTDAEHQELNLSQKGAGSVPECAYIDPTGFAYESAPQATGGLILVVESDAQRIAVGETVIEPAVMEQLGLLRDGLPAAAGLEVVGFELRSRVPSEIRAGVSDGFTIIFGRDEDFANTLRVLKRVLDEEINPHTSGGVGVKDKRGQLDYIDLRFGNKVFYKLK